MGEEGGAGEGHVAAFRAVGAEDDKGVCLGLQAGVVGQAGGRERLAALWGRGHDGGCGDVQVLRVLTQRCQGGVERGDREWYILRYIRCAWVRGC